MDVVLVTGGENGGVARVTLSGTSAPTITVSAATTVAPRVLT